MNNAQSTSAQASSSSRERRAQRFLKVAPARVNKVVKAMRVLGRCGNRLVYDYTDDQVAKIFVHIDESLKDMKLKFRQKEKEDSSGFKF